MHYACRSNEFSWKHGTRVSDGSVRCARLPKRDEPDGIHDGPDAGSADPGVGPTVTWTSGFWATARSRGGPGAPAVHDADGVHDTPRGGARALPNTRQPGHPKQRAHQAAVHGIGEAAETGRHETTEEGVRRDGGSWLRIGAPPNLGRRFAHLWGADADAGSRFGAVANSLSAWRCAVKKLVDGRSRERSVQGLAMTSVDGV